MKNLNQLSIAILFAIIGIPICIAQPVSPKNQKYLAFKKKQLNNFKLAKPLINKSISLSNNSTEVVDLSNFAKFPEEKKQVFSPKLINGNCNALPVNYKSSQQEIGLFFPPTGYSQSIYPGAVYRFSTLKNLAPTPYTRFTKRSAMNLNTDIFDPNIIESNSSETISQFDYGTISNKWKNMLAKYINGITPANVVTEISLIESSKQLNSLLNTASSVDVGAKLQVPLPNIPVSVSASNTVSVQNTTTQNNSSTLEKNSVIIKIKQVFYSSSISYIDSDDISVFPGVNPAELEEDLVYIKSVDYGQEFYIVVTSDYSKESILNAVMDKVSTKSELGASVTGIPVSGSVSVGTSNETNSSTESILSSGSTTVKTFQYGGAPIDLGQRLEDVLNSLKSKLDLKFSKTNIGAPLSYTLCFVKDHTPVWINTDLSYATTNCGISLANRLYEVKLILEKLNAKKVVDNDNTEDLYGNLKLNSFKTNGVTKITNYTFWERKGETYDTNSAKGVTFAYNGTDTKINSSKILLSNCTNGDLLASSIFVEGLLYDKDLMNPKYVCKECNGGPREINLSAYANQINALLPNETKKLKIGDDSFFELNFFENGDKNSSHIKTYWSIEVTAK